MPGYSPPGAERTFTNPLPSFAAGSVSASGGYQLSADEKALDCSKLAGSMHIIMSRLNDSANKPVQSSSSTAMQSISAPFSQGPVPLNRDAEIQREKARLAAYNGLLMEKGCKTLDITAYQ